MAELSVGRPVVFRGVVFAAHSVEDARFGFEFSKALFILNGVSVHFSALPDCKLVGQAPLRRFVVSAQLNPPTLRSFIFDAFQYHAFSCPRETR